MKILKIILILVGIGILIYLFGSIYWEMIRFMFGLTIAIGITIVVSGILIFGISGLTEHLFPDFWKRMEEKMRQKNILR